MLKHIKTEYKDQEPLEVECATDYEREDKIERAMSCLKSAGRSEDAVKRMEAERGLV